MIRELVTDEAILSQKCAPATADDAELAQDLIDTVHALDDASCIAANQIGETKAVVVFVDDKGHDHVLYNPRIMLGMRASRTVESCLTREEPSVVKRFAKVKVAYDELVDGVLKPRKRDYDGWYAQMIQHLVDHCNGKLV